MSLEEILTKYPSLRKMHDTPEEEIVESHDGREVTLLKYIYNHPELNTKLRGNPRAILDVMDEFAAKEDFLINIGPDKARVLTDVMKEHRPRVVVELGGYVGYSAILFGSILQNMQWDGALDQKSLRVISLELDPLIASIAMNLVSLAGLSGLVEVIVGPAAETLQRLHDQHVLGNGNEGSVGVDMLFLDHVEDLYQSDLQLCEKLGFLDRPGALVVADNVVRPGAPAYREYVRINPQFSKSWGVPGLIIPGEFQDELEVSVVGSH